MNSEIMAMGEPPDPEKRRYKIFWIIIVVFFALTSLLISFYLSVSDKKKSSDNISHSTESNDGKKMLVESSKSGETGIEDGNNHENNEKLFIEEIRLEFGGTTLTVESREKLRTIRGRIGAETGRLKIVAQKIPKLENTGVLGPAAVVNAIAEELREAGLGADVRLHKLYFATISFVPEKEIENAEPFSIAVQFRFEPDFKH